MTTSLVTTAIQLLINSWSPCAPSCAKPPRFPVMSPVSQNMDQLFSCGARRMVETAALLVDDVLPHKRIRQWVVSFPYLLRFLLANNPQVMGSVLGIVVRVISTHLIKKAGFKKSTAKTGVVTLIQRFGSALNLNLHFHALFIDGVYQQKKQWQTTVSACRRAYCQ